MRSNLRPVLALLIAVSFMAAACSSSDPNEATAPTPPSGVGSDSGGDSAAGGGWLDGNPADAGPAAGTVGDAAMEGEAAPTSMSDGMGADMAAASEARLTIDGPVDSGPPRAGSTDDNETFAEYLAYLDRIAGLDIAVRAIDVRQQHRVVVTGSNGAPVAGVAVEVLQEGAVIGTVRTGADGVALLHPAAMSERETTEALTYSVEGIQGSLDAPAIAVELERPGGPDAVVALDVLFLIDATGSMGDEIERLKSTVDEVALRASALDTPVDLRLGLTVYRDEGDAYVTRTFDFTADVGSFQAALADVTADGGGDYPEALDEALADALAKPAWRSPDTTIQLVFLLADAPPQIGRQVEQPYDASLRIAAERGIRIYPIASSGSDDQAEYVFRQLAQFTGSRFVFLSYGVGGAAVGESSDIDSTDYEELPLEDLLVRLVSEEVADLVGAEVSAPPSETTTTTFEQ